jgi:orotate phosphoribosyltransferase
MHEVAEILLDKRAVTLRPDNPYTYASGIRSPIYCDNRLLAAYPLARKKIVAAFLDTLAKTDFDIIAGTSTAGIMWAAWIADRLEKPVCYVRGEQKKHGKQNQIEGATVAGKKVVVIEDLISTGGSSFEAVKAVRDNGGKVNDVVAIFTYGFAKAKALFDEGQCKVHALTDFQELPNAAKENSYITEQELRIVLEWNKAPAEWGPRHGFPNAK